MITVTKLSDQVHDLLLRQIMEGDRSPGSTLRELDLVEELQVSRTPIREAISRLAAEGFVEVQPNRGATVRLLDADQVRQIFEVREALEARAAEAACPRMSEEDLERLSSIAGGIAETEPDAPVQRWRLDRELHTLIAGRTGNALLAEEIERYIDLAGLVGSRARYQRGDAEAAHQEHLRIVSALENCDAAAARAAMATHIRNAGELIMRRSPAADR